MRQTASELYADCAGDGYFSSPSSYQPMLDSFGTILVQVDDNDYQGDSRVLYRDGQRFGWLQFGWGSCSGCDALQACDSFAEIEKLMEELCSQVRWFDSAAECLKFFNEHDWESDYSNDREEQKKFIADCKAYLSGVAK